MTTREVIVITGTGGMGMAIARRIGAGRTVVLADFDRRALDAAATVLTGEGHDIVAVEADVSDRTSVEALAAAAAAAGPIRAVVHTAGVSPAQADSSRIVAVDVVGTAHVLDVFEAHVVPGTVAVCIASMAGAMAPLPAEVEHALGVTPTAELAALPVLDPSRLDPGSAYAVAKRANHCRVRAASVPWGARGGRVVSISPGVISTPMGQQELASEVGDIMRHMVSISATKRLGTPDDIAAAVEFLISPQASFITGTDLLVDGGVVAALAFASR